jgi:hypothetical protein
MDDVDPRLCVTCGVQGYTVPVRYRVGPGIVL